MGRLKRFFFGELGVRDDRFTSRFIGISIPKQPQFSPNYQKGFVLPLKKLDLSPKFHR